MVKDSDLPRMELPGYPSDDVRSVFMVLHTTSSGEICDTFLDEQLLVVVTKVP